ncbi:hypothetical protein JCM10207_007845 [Rhodosporidiobolus poonsookiae]
MLSSRRLPPYALLLVVLLLVFALHTRHSTPFAPRAIVVLQAYETTGLRPAWVRAATERYTSAEYRDVVERVVLVWNNPGAEPVEGLPEEVEVVRAEVNSVANRWTLPRRFLEPDSRVFTVDNDLAVTPAALRCLLAVSSTFPDRLAGPLVRRRNGHRYIMDELQARHAPYHMVLAGFSMARAGLLDEYNREEYAPLRKFVDEDEAHCDDVLVNFAATHATGQPPLRVLLPPASVLDYSSVCGALDRAGAAGLSDRPDRAALRSACLAHFLDSPLLGGEGASLESAEVAVCSGDGTSFELTTSGVGIERWRAMASATAEELCPDLLPMARNVLTRADCSASSPSSPFLSAPRTPAAQALAAYCPSLDAATSEWIDAASDWPVCGTEGEEPREVEEVVGEMGRLQCGTWCIWDLRTRTKTGWHLEPAPSACWRRFDERARAPEESGGEGPCEEWFWQRPEWDL